MRAIVKVQHALKQDLSLAETVGKRLFPEKEASLIRALIERDQAGISAELVTGMNAFAARAGLLHSEPVAYEDIVAMQCHSCW